jgi:hypothetical protein
MEKHVLNEEFKRLEPISKECFYCANGKVTDINECHYGSLFKENDRTNIVVYRSVKYSEIKIGIPRCNECANIHNGAGSNSAMIGIIAGIAICVTCGVIWGAVGCFLGLIAGIAVGFFLDDYYETELVEKKGISSEKNGFVQDDTVRTFIAMGWELTQPAA